MCIPKSISFQNSTTLIFLMSKVITPETHHLTQSNVLKEALAIRILLDKLKTAYVVRPLSPETSSPAVCSDVILPMSVTSLDIKFQNQLTLSED